MAIARISSGFTLFEALLAAVILAIVVGAIIMPFTAGAANTAQNARSTLAVNLAQDLMEEILAKSFSDPDGKEAGENKRSKWDDMGDYNGYSEVAGEIAGFDGAAVDDPASVAMTRDVAVESIYVAGQSAPDPSTFLRITVNVRYRGEKVITLSRLAYANE